MTLIEKDLSSLVINVKEDKKGNSNWMVEEQGNSFLESYDSFSARMTISDHDL